MKKVYIAALAIFASASVYAGGPTLEASVGSAAPSWTGFYVGGDIGYMWGDANLYDVNGYDSIGVNANNPFTYKPDGAKADVRVGYNKLFGTMFLVGAEAEGGILGINGSKQYPPFIGVSTRVNNSIATTHDGGFFSLSARLGFVGWERVLFYGKGGYAWTDVGSTFIDTNSTGITLSQTTTPTHDGAVYGGGIEYAFTNNWFGRVEYNHYDLGTVTSSGLGSNGTTYNFRHTLTANAVTVGASYNFFS